ncbi:UNVERIFIED_CONTAM: Retrovirus-related Pol polyprotein from type-2 retrotransposable element R2DM [Sesamum radiatum]|uniref:Retrovirus-related Pol polyprotein from type-2 retrotransposable element R2DM n=1 Tax=Sesamum radiatum TaxID=300843 RepID=A0AAW2JGM3_SESRA
MHKVTDEFISVFQTLLGGVRRRRTIDLSWLRSDANYVLSTGEGECLILPVTEEEIKEAFFDISEESAPGPDGYTSLFYKAAWPVIGRDVCEAVKEFFVSGRLLKQINATTLTLIPKVQMPSQVSDYRPISCCNVIYKAITKVMVKRLQQVLHLIVDQSQNAFVPGRSIADNILLAQELLAGYNQVKLPPRCTIKVDIQKAYDSIEWDFLLASLKLFNFPQKFIDWVEQCISTVMFSISLNGSLSGFFPSARGIRQGDPISPYLFVIVMEVWRIILHKRVQAAADFHYHWKCKEQGILNLCFADDVLIFCKGTVQSVRVIKAVLDEFASDSGLKVNPNKSQVILSRAAQSVRYEIVNIMGFQEGSLPIRYLGVPLVSTKLSIADCRPLLQKIDARLAGWSHLNLSFAGRTQLLRSVMSAMHAYWASVFLLPKAVIKEIEARMRRFLWRGSSDRGYAKVSWDQVCKPKCEGGLGIRRVMHLNQALMLKHVWRLLREDRSSIWVQWVLLHRLQRQSLWTSNLATATWCWKQLLKISHILKPGLDYRVGNGDKFKVWLDIWHERGPLIRHYPRGPLVTGVPLDALLSEVLQQGSWAWPSETDFDVAEIIANLPQIHPGESDSIHWKLNAGCFNTAAVFSLLEPASPTVVWHVLLGGRFKIPRHTFILWLAIKGRLSTMDRPWMNDVADGLCPLQFCGSRDSQTFVF